jgi:hypothetical protein
MLFLIFSAIAFMNLGGTELPILAHCSLNFPININSSGNDASLFNSPIPRCLFSSG